MRLITGPRSKFDDRCRQRGTTIDAVRECITHEDGANVTVDVDHPAYPRPKPKQWPLLARALRKLARPHDRGLGDVVERYAAKVGGDAFKRVYKKLVGRDCGCADRQASLNAIYPFRQGEKVTVETSSDVPY